MGCPYLQGGVAGHGRQGRSITGQPATDSCSTLGLLTGHALPQLEQPPLRFVGCNTLLNTGEQLAAQTIDQQQSAPPWRGTAKPVCRHYADETAHLPSVSAPTIGISPLPLLKVALALPGVPVWGQPSQHPAVTQLSPCGSQPG